jgi:hypothetical protein
MRAVLRPHGGLSPRNARFASNTAMSAT